MLYLPLALLALLALATSAAGAVDLDDPAEPWLKTRVGVTDKVPAPFEPLQVAGDAVSCWGRRYQMAFPLPARISSQGEELLTSPIRLALRSGGKDVVVAGRPLRLTSQAGNRVEFAGAEDAAGLILEGTGWVEFDGALRLDLTLKPRQAITVDRLAVEIPLRPEIARTFHASSRWGKYLYGRVGSEADWKWASNWQASLWLGDHARGLSVVTETAAGWSGGEDALQIERAPDAVVLRLNVISRPTEITGERRYRFGLQATPGKPLPVGWHGRHPGQGSADVTPEGARRLRESGVNIALLWNSDTKWFSYPQAKDAEKFRQAVRTYHEAGIRSAVYITLSGTGPESAVEQRHHDEWMMTADGKVVFTEKGVEGKSHGLTSTCPGSTYTDWLVWAVDRAMEEYDLDGVYIDNPGPYYCENTRHGHGGADGRTYPYFQNRELEKRLWAVIHGRKPEAGIVWEHNSRTSNSFDLTFVDIYSDGEHFRVKSKGTPEGIDRTLLEVTASGRQWGAQACFLPSALNAREQYTAWLLARMLPYGNVLMSVPSWMDYSLLSPVLRARLAFGLEREPVEWFTPEGIPPWLKVSPADLLVGGYLRDGRMLLTVSNVSEEKAAARIDTRPLAAKLGGKVVARDAGTGAECTFLGPNLLLALPANSFRVILIERI